MKTDILPGFLDDLALQHVFEIFAHHLKRHRLRAFQHPEGRAIDASRLPVALRLPRAAVEQRLGYGDADIGRIERIVLDAGEPAGRIVEPAHAGRRIEIDARHVEAAGLAKLELYRLPVLYGLSDLGIGFKRDGDRLTQRDRMRSTARKRDRKRRAHRHTDQNRPGFRLHIFPPNRLDAAKSRPAEFSPMDFSMPFRQEMPHHSTAAETFDADASKNIRSLLLLEHRTGPAAQRASGKTSPEVQLFISKHRQRYKAAHGLDRI